MAMRRLTCFFSSSLISTQCVTSSKVRKQLRQTSSPSTVVRRLPVRSAVVAATPHIRRRFEPVTGCVVDVNNYPVFDAAIVPAVPRDPQVVCYVGTIEPIRGIFEMIRALEHVDARLVLAGPWDRPETESQARALPGWARVDYRGRVGRAEAWKIMAGASAGLVVLHPAPNHTDAQPTKMFEYMASGTPLVASDLPVLREVLRDRVPASRRLRRQHLGREVRQQNVVDARVGLPSLPDGG